jgi:hypothetical protein
MSGIEGYSAFESVTRFAMIRLARRPWRCNFDRTANIATGTFRPTQPKPASAAMNARSARTASRPNSAMSARTAVAALHRGRSGPPNHGAPACARKRSRHRTSACISNSAMRILPRIAPGSGTFRRRHGENFQSPSLRAKRRNPSRCHSGMVRRTRPGISRFPDVQLYIVVRCFASPRNDRVNPPA